MKYSIGVDVGGTTSTIALGNGAREVIHVSEQFDSLTREGPSHTIDSIANQIWSSLKSLGLGPELISDVGLATPGPASLDGLLMNSPNFDPKLWNEFPFRAALEASIRATAGEVSVHYIGDGQAAALGEFSVRSGAIQWDRITLPAASPTELSSLFMLIVGTGLGGGEIRSGRVVRGRAGRAGHAGHVMLPACAFRHEHDRRLLVGNAYCTAESAVSLTALTHQLEYRLTLKAWRDHPLASSPGTIREKAKQLRQLAASGDPLARELFHDQARALGITLLAVNYVGDYDLLIIGGGVCDLEAGIREQYRHTAEAAYREFALDGFRNLDRFEFSLCGDDAPVIGALAYAYSQSSRSELN